MLSNPASSKALFWRFSCMGWKLTPSFLPALRYSMFQKSSYALSGATVPSSLRISTSASQLCTQPPGLVTRYACFRSSFQSAIAPNRYRPCTKSNVFSGHVHGCVQSSSSNLTFGGTHNGCVGDRSVPITSAFGYWSAKSLFPGSSQ